MPLATSLAKDSFSLSGLILLQVEEHGEAWYVAPDTLTRYYLGRPQDAFALMRSQGVGISNADLEKIPLGLQETTGTDTDQDGLADLLEEAIGTDKNKQDSDGDGYNDRDEIVSGHNPQGLGSLPINVDFIVKQAGKIFLQVEGHGEAWYIWPGNLKRYYLGRPSDAFAIMRNMGLGITNADLLELSAVTVGFDWRSLEKKIHDLVNNERLKNNLTKLTWNEEVAQVARQHSQDLAQENKQFTALNAVCSYPLIHHEGFNFGLYQNDRLANSGIQYYNKSGENIALLSSAIVTLTYKEGDIDTDEFSQCSIERNIWDNEFKQAIETAETNEAKENIWQKEIDRRKYAFTNTPRLATDTVNWQNLDELAKRAVTGWMNSPGHKANILKNDYNEAGLGVAYVNSYVIITQVFINHIDCGYEGANCCVNDNYQLCYEPNSCVNNICQK